jgi:UDP-3-O-[3-hydroxymyristoyl] glucosamine N-acyltransferase
MFVRSVRLLSEYASLFSEIRTDCEFHSIGKIPSRIAARLVPVGGRKHLEELYQSLDGIIAVICPKELANDIPAQLGCAISEVPVQTSYEIHRDLVRKDAFWQSFTSRVHPTASVHAAAYIAPTDVQIGANTVVAATASIHERSIVGSDCYIGPGTVIGSPAYEVSNLEGRQTLLPQAGGVLIGNNCAFLANTTVARSIFPLFTEIGDDCSFDNLVHVAHDCLLGRGVKMTACSMLSGRVTIRDNAYIGPNATVSNGLTIGEKATITIGSVVVRDVPDGTRVTGNFAVAHGEHLRRQG